MLKSEATNMKDNLSLTYILNHLVNLEGCIGFILCVVTLIFLIQQGWGMGEAAQKSLEDVFIMISSGVWICFRSSSQTESAPFISGIRKHQ